MASELAIFRHSLDFWQVDSDGVTPLANTKINTWDDWHLVPSSRPSVASPTVNTNYVEVPAYNGYLDLTDQFGAGVKFGAREGEFTLLALLPPLFQDYGNWAVRKRTMEEYVHGNLLYFALSEDPAYWFFGRWTFEWTNTNDGICAGSCKFGYHAQPKRIPRLLDDNGNRINLNIDLSILFSGATGSGGNNSSPFTSQDASDMSTMVNRKKGVEVKKLSEEEGFVQGEDPTDDPLSYFNDGSGQDDTGSSTYVDDPDGDDEDFIGYFDDGDDGGNEGSGGNEGGEFIDEGDETEPYDPFLDEFSDEGGTGSSESSTDPLENNEGTTENEFSDLFDDNEG